jgi:hypothetical protein
VRRDLSLRFWEKVDRSGDCWMWTGNLHMHGYGRIHIAGRVEKAHRVAWTLTNGPIPVGLHVLHDCDRPACVNPAHLHLGTHADNMREMFERKRRVAREGCNNAWKLTADQVREIRRRYAAGGTSHRKLAAEYGVCPPYIGDIVNRTAWAYVDDEPAFLAADAVSVKAYLGLPSAPAIKLEVAR